MKKVVSLLLILSFNLTSLRVYGDYKEKISHSEEWLQNSKQAEKWVFKDLPRHIAGDLKETFWNGWHLLFLTAGALSTEGIHNYDKDIQEAFQPERPLGKTFDDVMKYGGHPLVLGGLTLASLGVSKWMKAKKAAIVTGTMLEAFTLTEAFTLGFQLTTQRERPDGSNSRSFPSGHTSGAFALATVAQVYYGPWVGIPSYVLASLVGIGRIDSNRHVASDVAAGALLGTLIGLGTAKFHKKEFSRFFLTPTVGEKSVGLALTYLF